MKKFLWEKDWFKIYIEWAFWVVVEDKDWKEYKYDMEELRKKVKARDYWTKAEMYEAMAKLMWEELPYDVRECVLYNC